jgi:hypothetical protein
MDNWKETWLKYPEVKILLSEQRAEIIERLEILRKATQTTFNHGDNYVILIDIVLFDALIKELKEDKL